MRILQSAIMKKRIDSLNIDSLTFRTLQYVKFEVDAVIFACINVGVDLEVSLTKGPLFPAPAAQSWLPAAELCL